MTDWHEEYKSKFISAEEAAKFVKSGDRVAFAPGREAFAIGLAIASRKEELKGVKIFQSTPSYDFGWFNPGWDDSFLVIIGIPTATSQEASDNKWVDFYTSDIIPFRNCELAMDADVLLAEVSPPDELGFCSFGASLWNKKTLIRNAKLTIAEVNKNLIRTYGDNFIHFSEIDYFVEHVTSGAAPGMGSLGGRELKKPEPYMKRIVENVSELIRDGDTIQIGIGRTTEPLVQLGILNGKKDLGVHTEATPPGIISLVRAGVINGKRKTINRERVTVTSIGGSTKEEMEWVNNNPLFELVDVEYLEDIRVIAAHDNMVAINNALAIDLGGQITAESLGTRYMSAAGGQIPFVIGALLSKEGRAITVLPSTAQNGKVSRIVPLHPEGTVVTIQRNCADYIVTEYGIAHVRGKTLRQRAQELINIAHPDFRAELKQKAHELVGL